MEAGFNLHQKVSLKEIKFRKIMAFSVKSREIHSNTCSKDTRRATGKQ